MRPSSNVSSRNLRVSGETKSPPDLTVMFLVFKKHELPPFPQTKKNWFGGCVSRQNWVHLPQVSGVENFKKKYLDELPPPRKRWGRFNIFKFATELQMRPVFAPGRAGSQHRKRTLLGKFHAGHRQFTQLFVIHFP